MVSLLSTRRVVEESVPVVALLLAWSVPAELLSGIDGAFVTGARVAGLVMALLYVTVRGLRLGRSIPPQSPPDGVRETLIDNAQAALAAGVWLGVAVLFEIVVLSADAVLGGGPGDPFEAVYFALAGTAVATVALYAIANGSARVRSPLVGRRSRGVRTDT